MSDFDDEFRIAEKRIKDEQAELKRKKEAEAAAKAAEKAAEEKRCSIIRKKYENEMRRVFAVIEPKFRHCGYHAELENGDIQIFRSLKTLGNLVTNQKRILNGLYYRWDAELSTSVLYDGEAAVKVHISREAQVNDRSKNWDTNWAIDFEQVEAKLAFYLAHSHVHGIGEINAQELVASHVEAKPISLTRWLVTLGLGLGLGYLFFV